MNRLVACRMGLRAALLFAAGLAGVAGTGRFRLVAVQTDRGQIGCVKSKSGYQIRLCSAPTAYHKARNHSSYTIHVGVFRAPANEPKFTAAQLWAFYE